MAIDRDVCRANILELIRRTSAYLPADAEGVIALHRSL